jgi:malate dehydrogenase (oxaloacetate-decarboxylating)
MAGLHVSGLKLKDMRMVVFGSGTAGTGIVRSPSPYPTKFSYKILATFPRVSKLSSVSTTDSIYQADQVRDSIAAESGISKEEAAKQIW